MKTDIILCGVGGQGILSIATIIGEAAINEGLYIKQAEVHGMSQRGGDVQSNLRISSNPINSDLIALGQADGNLVSINPAACALMGVNTTEEALQKGINIHHLKLFSEAQLASTEEVTLTDNIELSDHSDAFILVDKGRRQTEAVFYYKASLQRIIDKVGNTQNFILSLTDISDLMGKKQLAQKLAEDSERLLKEINKHSAYLDYTLTIGGTRMAKYDPKTKVISTTRMDEKLPMTLPQLQMLSECSHESLPELFRIFTFMDSYTDENVSARFLSALPF